MPSHSYFLLYRLFPHGLIHNYFQLQETGPFKGTKHKFLTLFALNKSSNESILSKLPTILNSATFIFLFDN